MFDRFDRFYNGKEANIAEAANSPLFGLVEGDILDKDALETAMKGSDVVFHLAGQAGVGFSVDSPAVTNSVNVDGTLNVLWLAKSLGVRRLVNASSSSIFGVPRYLPIDEDHPTNPTSPYGVSKLSAEQYSTVFDRIYGLETVSLRYFSVYGPRGRPDQVIHRFTKALLEGSSPVISGDGTHSRDFTYVTDAVAATILAAETQEIGGEVFNIGFGGTTSINELAGKLITLTGMEGKVAPKYEEGSKGDFPATRADNSKAARILGWRPKIGLDEGLKRYVNWFSSSVKFQKGPP